MQNDANPNRGAIEQEELRRIVEMHMGSGARSHGKQHIVAQLRGPQVLVWEGDVYIFELQGFKLGHKCFALKVPAFSDVYEVWAWEETSTMKDAQAFAEQVLVMRRDSARK